MKILIPPSEGKAKVKPTKTIFSETKFMFEREVSQVVRLLELMMMKIYVQFMAPQQKRH